MTPAVTHCATGVGVDSDPSPSAITTRNPITSMRVSHQMLCGSHGSHFSQLLSDTRRAALRHRSALSAHDPPRAT